MVQAVSSVDPESVSIALAGDVMTGRGVDQIMRRPGDPALYETWAGSALRYVELAETRSGSLPRGVDPAYIWGDTPDRLDSQGVDVRIVNLETAVTARGTPWPHKGIHYRAHPANADCLVAGDIDVAVVANNHVMDWSEPGLEDTIDTLDHLGVQTAGAGRDLEEAWRPARSGRVIVLGLGSPSSGVDPAWAAGPNRPGVALLQSLTRSSVERAGEALGAFRRTGDVVVVSIHWGPNWGHEIPSAHRRFARDLIDRAGVDVVHGHSSHHPMGFEVYRDRLILYGCGDLLTDYEGISGHEEFRPELGAWYIVTFDGRSGGMKDLSLVPTRLRRFQLTTPSREETEWLAGSLEAHGVTAGVSVQVWDDILKVVW